MAKLMERLSSFERRQLSHEEQAEIARTGLNSLRGDGPPPTLGELFMRVGDATMDVDGDDVGNYQSPQTEHHVIELDNFSAVGGDCNKQRYPYLPFVLEFRDLTYSVKTRKKSFLACGDSTCTTPSKDENVALDEVSGMKRGSRMKTLLNSISGEAREGEIMAVLGASGSGKSTLVDALAKRISSDSLGGSVTLNGEPLTGRLLKAISAYVMQDDLLFPMLTVEETLMFSAEFRLPRSLSASKKRQRVQTLIDQLGLRGATNTVIGDEGHRGVSGGERRRVSIGIDIIHDPIILFLDEPTSGLDSTSAFMVVKVLQNIAQTGSVVIMTIHQPSSRILGLLDRLIFLSRGNTVFSGTPNDLQSYFSEFGKPIPENENRTEFALDLIRVLEGNPTEIRRLIEHNKNWEQMKAPANAGTPENAGVSLKDAIGASISRGKLVSGATDGAAGASSGGTTTMQKYANPFWVEMGVLTRRSFLNTKRQPKLFGIRLGTVLVTGFILATIFWQVDDSPKGVQERLGFFAIAMSTMFYTCADALPIFLHERYIFMRETAYNAYRRSSYVLANSVVAIPPLIILAIAFASTTFFAVGLAGGLHGFGFFLLIIFASFWSGSSFVTFLSGVIPHVMMGYTVVVAILAYFLLLSGFFITRDRIPGYWLWFHYLSLIKYPYEAVLRNEFNDSTRCFVRGVQIFDTSPLASLSYAMKVRLLKGMSSTLGISITPNTCLTTGVNILRQQGVTDLTKWNALFITFAWGFLFRILFYFTLLLGSKNKRR